MLTVFTSPSRYTQGKGATAALGREMTTLGLEGPVLFIAGKTVISLLARDLAAEPGGGRTEARGPPLQRRMLAGGDRAGQGRRS